MWQPAWIGHSKLEVPTGCLDGNVPWEVARLSSKAVLTLDSFGCDMDMGMVAKTEGVQSGREEGCQWPTGELS